MASPRSARARARGISTCLSSGLGPFVAPISYPPFRFIFLFFFRLYAFFGSSFSVYSTGTRHTFSPVRTLRLVSFHLRMVFRRQWSSLAGEEQEEGRIVVSSSPEWQREGKLNRGPVAGIFLLEGPRAITPRVNDTACHGDVAARHSLRRSDTWEHPQIAAVIINWSRRIFFFQFFCQIWERWFFFYYMWMWRESSSMFKIWKVVLSTGFVLGDCACEFFGLSWISRILM